MRLKYLITLLVTLGLASVTLNMYRLWSRKPSGLDRTSQDAMPKETSNLSDWYKAAEEKERWLAVHPDDWQTRQELARQYFIAQDFTRAAAQLSVLKKQRPNDPQVLLRLSMALRHDGQLDDALDAIQKAIKLDPKKQLAREWLGEIYLAQGRTTDAVMAFDESLKQDPKSFASLMGKARSLEQLYTERRPVDVKTIITAVQRAVEVQPDNDQAVSTLARMIFTYTGDAKRAEKLANEAIRLNPSNAYPYLILVEINLVQPTTERLLKAKQFATKAAELDPHNPEPFYLLARVQWRLNEVKETIESLEKSMKIRSMPQSIYLLAQAYSRTGETEKASKYNSIYQKWNLFMEKRKKLMGDLQHRPYDVNVYCDFAELYLSTGDLVPAENWLRKTRNLRKTNPRVQRLFDRLEDAKRSPGKPANDLSSLGIR